jgi:hypothetical protein
VPPESDDNLHLEIGHVLFIDIVGYSKLLNEEQQERLNQLTEIVQATTPVREATDEQLVRLPTGDGMALVFHHSAEEPARCALEIAEALQKHPELPVRMGIHSGPVNKVTDVSGRTNLAGAGINMAQRVMDCGDAGHILLSQHVADDLVQSRQWAPRLRDLGECEVKHGVHLHLVNLYAEPLGNAVVPKKLQQAKSKRARSRNVGWIAALALIVILAAGAYYFGSYRVRTKGVPISENSIAVLPFVNMSSDKEQEFFSDGISEELLNLLAKIPQLKVAARTLGRAHCQLGMALMQKGDATSALAEIEQEKSEAWRMIGLPMAYCALGRKADADAALNALIAKYEKDAPYNIAYDYAFCGDADKAFEWLDKAVAYQDGGLAEIVTENLFDKIHSDPRWLPFLRKIGKAPDQLAKIEFKVPPPPQ